MRRALGRYLSLAVILVLGLSSVVVTADTCCPTTGSCCVQQTNCCDSYGVIDCDSCCNGKSRSFFSPRTISDDTAYEYALHGYNAYHNKFRGRDYSCDTQPAAFTVQSTFFYQESNSADELAQYFLKCNKCELSVRENGSGDLGSSWFNIFADPSSEGFSSCISIAPKRKVYGGIIKYRQELCCLLKGLWASVLMPIVRVEHNMNLCERNVQNPGVAEANGESFLNEAGDHISNMVQAFNSRAWCFGKIKCGKMEKSGIDDLQFNLGYDVFARENWHLGVRFDMLIPMGCRPTSNYLFEPTVGNGGHFGLGFGTNFDYNFWNTENGGLTFLADFRYRYLFSGRQCRSFDLTCNGDWSRYLSVADCGNPCECCPGINFFTRNVEVTPRSSINLLGALHYQHNSIGFEFGYNFWWRQAEDVCLADSCCERIGICDDVTTSTVCTDHTTLSKARICNGTSQFAQDAGKSPMVDASFVKIKDCDLDLCSATHPSAMSHKIYAAVSLDAHLFGCKNMFGFGGSYEFGDACSAMDNWAVWGKVSSSF